MNPNLQTSVDLTAPDDVLARERGRDRRFRWLVTGMAMMVLLVLGAILMSLVIGSMPAFDQFGWKFLTSRAWDPIGNDYGALSAIYGTVVTSAIALLLAVPISFFIAFFLTELCPKRLRSTVNGIIELLAGIPSIIYGMWGLFVLAPLLAQYVQPRLDQWFHHIWLLDRIFQGPPIGIGLLPAALILSLMVVPFITSVMREVFEVVPYSLKEAGYGIGGTTWEVMWDIVVPYTRIAIVGGIMLGLGRALGETMAVTFMIGNNNNISAALFDSGNSIASVIANEFAEAADPLHASALTELGLILFVITFIVLAVARLLIMRVERRA
ncbi:MAG: phosphate ABC transporter permease subunit PstC [Pseudomonadales bacterium]|nr:phosphate ABC transporter permease subunit PstC [Pseudomonadales bacterium]